VKSHAYRLTGNTKIPNLEQLELKWNLAPYPILSVAMQWPD
jgi:hypothetical protein